MEKAKTAKKSMFDTAEVMPKTKSPAAKDVAIEFEKPFDTLVNLMIVKNHIEAVMSSLADEFKSGAAFDIFMEKMRAEKKQISSFKAACDDAQATFQFAKKGAGMGTRMKEVLDQHGIDYDVATVTEERFLFNPEVFQDKGLMRKIDEALQKVQEQTDISILQKQEAVEKYQFNDNTIRQIIEKVQDADEQAEILKAIADRKISAPLLGGQDHSDQQTVSKALHHILDNDVVSLKAEKKNVS